MKNVSKERELLRHFDKWVDCPASDISDTDGEYRRCPKCAAIRSLIESSGEKGHVCKPDDTCSCYQLADTPNEKCPVHGSGLWPAHCAECGRFLPAPSPGPTPHEQARAYAMSPIPKATLEAKVDSPGSSAGYVNVGPVRCDVPSITLPTSAPDGYRMEARQLGEEYSPVVEPIPAHPRFPPIDLPPYAPSATPTIIIPVDKYFFVRDGEKTALYEKRDDGQPGNLICEIPPAVLHLFRILES
jgi:hypothetical protein